MIADLIYYSAPHEDRTHVLYKQYSDVLVQLTSLGALLSSVKPEFLLSLDEYRVIVQRRATAMVSEMSYREGHPVS